VDGLEGLFPALVQDARQIDRKIGAGERGRDPVLVLHIAAKQLDLAHVAHGWQVVRIVRTADDGPDTVALSGEAPDDMATQEARGSEDRDKLAIHGFVEPRASRAT